MAICIYGLGRLGIDTYYILKENGISVEVFADRDERKKGYVLDGIYCISYEDLVRRADEYEIIVCVKSSMNLLKEKFLNEGIRKVYTADEIEDLYPIKKKRNFSIEEIAEIHQQLSDAIDDNCSESIIDEQLKSIVNDLLIRKNKKTGELDEHIRN